MKSEKLTLKVKGMTCGGCENLVQTSLSEQAGVLKAEASHQSNQVEVEVDPERYQFEDLKKAVEEVGYHIEA